MTTTYTSKLTPMDFNAGNYTNVTEYAFSDGDRFIKAETKNIVTGGWTTKVTRSEAGGAFRKSTLKELTKALDGAVSEALAAQLAAKPKAATPQQIRELAQAISDQAQAIADGKIPAGRLHAQVARLLGNVDTLKAWTPDDRAVGR